MVCVRSATIHQYFISQNGLDVKVIIFNHYAFGNIMVHFRNNATLFT